MLTPFVSAGFAILLPLVVALGTGQDNKASTAVLQSVGAASTAGTDRTSSHANATTGIRFVNDRWNSVTVEVRMGVNATCDAHSRLKRNVLDRGESWAFTGTMSVCWRAEDRPDAQKESWTEWTLIQLADHRRGDIAL